MRDPVFDEAIGEIEMEDQNRLLHELEKVALVGDLKSIGRLVNVFRWYRSTLRDHGEGQVDAHALRKGLEMSGIR